MNRLTLAIGIALLCAIPAHAQDKAVIVTDRSQDTVIVKDPDPPTPAIQQTTTTTRTDHYETVTPVHATGASVVHRPVHHHPVHHPYVAYHRPVPAPVATHHSVDSQTTTKTTVTIPPRDPKTVVSEHADGSVTVTTSEAAVEVQPADPDDGQH